MATEGQRGEDPGAITYNIPCALLPAFRKERVVVRSHTPSDLVGCLSAENPQQVAFLQLISLPRDVTDLTDGLDPVPLDLVMVDPEAEYPLLYPLAPLLDRQPVRISIPAAPGFGKAVRLAASLTFAVKLEVGQPPETLVDEMATVLDFFLHNPTVSRPIEPFYGLLMAFFHGTPDTLWQIQEEDPAFFRYVDEKGRQTISRRLAKRRVNLDPAVLTGQLIRQMDDLDVPCRTCAFRRNCFGYFRLPQRAYDCCHVKQIFSTLKHAADEIAADLADGPLCPDAGGEGAP